MQAGDECRTGTVQQRDVLAGAAEQISALDLLQRHVTAIQLHSKLLIGRAERPLDTRPAQEKPADSFGVAGLIRDRRLTELLNRTNFRTVNGVVGNTSIEDLPVKLVEQRGSVTEPLSFTSAFDPRQFQFTLRLTF